MKNYYDSKLNSEKLFQVYETKIERVKQYLDAEIDFVRRQLNGNEKVLELGAGFGRIMKKLAPYAFSITGIDISQDTVALGEDFLKTCPNCKILMMDAHNPKFDTKFDVVLCLQNGLSALKGDSGNIIKQTARLLSNDGKGFFSSYSERFWDYRLQWFFEQSSKGLLGEIDLQKTKDGTIVCKDGFVSLSFSYNDFEKLGEASGCDFQVVDAGDAIFLILTKKI